MEEEAGFGVVRVAIEVFDSLSIKRTTAADDAMDDVIFAQQQFGEIRAVLACDAGD